MNQISPIIPTRRKDLPPEKDGWAWELKLDGFRGLGDTINGRMLSKNLNPVKRFQHLLEELPFDSFSMARFAYWIAMVGPSSMICCSGGVIRSMWFLTCCSMSGKTFAPYC